jgi:hypothetical protein
MIDMKSKKVLYVVLILVVISFAASYFVMSYGNPNRDEEVDCENSGGHVVTAMCCKGTSDFPNLCLIGACGCSPSNSREIKICDCGSGKCFDGQKCMTIS